LTAGRVGLSADFEDSAIVYAPKVLGAVASYSHCLLKKLRLIGDWRKGEWWLNRLLKLVSHEDRSFPTILASKRPAC
jgi:hypothetical protein